MKRWMGILLALLLTVLSVTACAETLGFGFVNNKDVAVRRDLNGKIVGRLPRDTCVWILESRTDKKGVLWYRINAGANQNYTNLDYTGWMKAEFIDAGTELWHDVTSVSAMSQGMIAVRSDGSAEVAGRLIPSPVDGRWISVRGLAYDASPIVQATAYWGNSYAFMTADGRVHGVDTGDEGFITDPLRLFSGFDFLFGVSRDGRLKSVIRGQAENLQWIHPASEPSAAAMARVEQIVSTDCRVLMRTQDGDLWVAGWTRDQSPEPEPDWSTWTDLDSVAAARADFDSNEFNQMIVAGVRRDGTVLACPDALARNIGGWTDLKAVALSLHGALGLKRDGTVVSAGWNGYPALDVTGWTDITEISMADDYGVGLRSDGTLVFAGSHIFMREGRIRK